MKILKLKLFQETACYKKPFEYKVAETYPLPPYSTVIGMFHKILSAQSGEHFPMEISIQGEYESIFSNYQTLRMYKKNKVTSMPRNVHQLLNVKLIIHVRAEDEIIDKIYSNIINGVETFTLGRNEDIVRLDDIKICNEVKETVGDILKHNAYIPDTDEYEDIKGIKYRLPTTYTIQNDLRIWKKTNVKFVEKGKWIQNAIKDEDGDLIFFANKRKHGIEGEIKMIAYAKSKPKETIKQHTSEVLNELKILKKLYGKKIIENKEIDEEQFWLTIEIACKYHDCGKIFTPFQNQILEKIKEEKLDTEFDYTIKHEQLSPLFIPEEVMAQLDKAHRTILLQAIYYHHERNMAVPTAVIIKEIWEKDFFPRIDEIEKEFGFPIAKKFNPNYVNKVSGDNRIDEDDEYYLEYCLIKGIVHRLDHTGSAHLLVEIESERNLGKEAEDFVNNKFEGLNNLQQFCKENQQENLLVVASTGYGKTESGAIWAENDKIIYTLPFRISLNDIFDRLSKLMEYKDVGLLHSTALDYMLENEEIKYPQELYEESKMMGTKILLSTINQFFYFALKYQGYEKIYSMLSHTKVIIDEIQAYEPRVTAIILKGLKMINDIGGKFMIMTATLPKIYQEYLEKEKIPFKIEKFYSKMNRHKIKVLDKNINEDIEELTNKAKENKILIICNTVDKAIEVYEKCKEKVELRLLHAKFIEKDKTELEKQIKDFARSDKKGLWVTTQIVEASLDIDFDYLYTEMSTLDSLFQRMGRCYRKREYDKKEPNIKIYTKEASGIKYVYDEQIHNLSTEMLKKYDNEILDEKTKAELVEELYSREKLNDTKYLKEFDEANRVLNNIVDYSLTEKEAKNILNDIKTVTVIPKEIFEENIELFEQYEKEKEYKIKNEILKKIRKLCINVGENQTRGRITPVGYGVKGIYYIMAKYDSEKGLLLKENGESFNDRSF